MGLLTYIRLKITATLLRFMFSMMVGKIVTKQDETVFIPSREKGRKIKIHKYGPKAGTTTKEPGPVLINLHGSGFMTPLHGTDDEFCHFVVDRTDYTILDATYRLAPEHPFPAALEDVEDIIRYVLAHSGDYDTKNISLSGFSAGGTLALAASLTSSFPEGTIKRVVGLYPGLIDMATDPAQKHAPDSTITALPPWMLRVFTECYTYQEGVDVKNSRLSPAFADPKTFGAGEYVFVTAAGDRIAPDAEVLGGRLEEAGKKVLVKRIEGVEHGWDKKPKKTGLESKRTFEAYEVVVDALKR